MNSPVWPCWAQTLTQLVVQVTLWLAVGAVAVAWARRRSPRAAAETTTWILSGVLLLTILAVMPWPAWCALPSLFAETDSTPASRTDPAPQAAPVVPAAGSWHKGDIDRLAPPLLARPDPAWEPEPVTADPREPAMAPSTHRWARIVPLLVTILAGGCLLRFGVALWAMRECRRRSRPVLDTDVRQLGEKLRRAMGVRRSVELRELPSLNTAATLGWRRPIILLPGDWRRWDLAEQTSVLAHELAHIRRGDYAGWLLAQLSRALHGYQPLLHVLIGWLRRDQELAADALAASFAGGPARYTQALCRLALRRDDATKPGLARAFLPAHLSVTLRVQILLSRKRRSEPMMARKWRIGLGLALFAGCLVIAGLRSPALAEQAAQPVPAPASVAPPPQAAPISPKTARERAIERRLNKPISIRCKERPLHEALDRLRDVTGISIIVDRAALEEEGIDLEHPVSLNLKNVPVRTVLHLLLRSVHLTWVIQDEVVQVTTERQARGKLFQRTYSVADLVIPIPNYYITATLGGGTPAAPAAPRPEKTEEERLIRLVVSTIAPATWSEVGGKGTIEYYPLGMALVINQTADVQEQIAELLDALRRLQDMEVATEIRLVSVSAAMARRLKREFGVDCTQHRQDSLEAASAGIGVNSDAGLTGSIVLNERNFDIRQRATFLDQGQVEQIMKTLQSDRRTNILQAPKLTLFNGQNATIQIEDQQPVITRMEKNWDGEHLRSIAKTEVVSTGFRCGVQAVIAADRRFVRLHLQAQLSELDPAIRNAAVTATPAAPNGRTWKTKPVTQEPEQPLVNSRNLETTVAVPDGGTVVLSGCKRSGAKAEQDGPGAETQYLLLMVTPRILINSADEEVRQTGVVTATPADRADAKQEKVRDLLAKYQQACRERRFDEARKLAALALALDPGCFSHGR
jgi:beta-lactamase regulating signal transducer with metallopeptidase domain